MGRPVTRIRGHYAADGGFRKGNGGAVISEEVTFAEEGAAGVYTGSIAIPAGATILDIIVQSTVLWAAGTSATMIVGDDDDPNGFYDAVDLKTGGDLEVSELLNFDNITEHAVPGVYLVDLTNLRNAYRATANNVIGEITTVGTTSSAGRTRMTVIYSLPFVVPAAAYVAS